MMVSCVSGLYYVSNVGGELRELGAQRGVQAVDVLVRVEEVRRDALAVEEVGRQAQNTEPWLSNAENESH